MVKPTVHRNGTSGERLFDAYSDAANAVYKAINAVSAINPNARDYYTQGDSAFPAARSEHEQRLLRLREIREELLAIADDIQTQRGL